MTDDRPYLDDPSLLGKQLTKAFSVSTDSNKPMAILYRSIVIQTLFVLLAGLLFILLPFVKRGPNRLQNTNGVVIGLLYVSCLGYGYLAIETVLIHELVLFVGHPTYAVTCTVLAMLLFSGLGAMWTEKIAADNREAMLKKILLSILFLGIIQCTIVPALLYTFELGWPLYLRLLITFILLIPLGFVMGMPFPLAVSIFREKAAGLIPWTWALNGWTSVVASLSTVLLSRIMGYSFAFVIALLFYAIAFLLAGKLKMIGPRQS